MTKPSRWALALACTLASLTTAPAALAAGGLRDVTVDASHPTGIIRSLQGVSGSPLPGDASHPDFTAQQRRMGVDLVRTHDIDCKGTGDIDGIGENRIFRDWSADPNDPASYNFGPTDRAILSIVRGGSEALFNLGHSDLSCAGLGFNNTPPPDPAKYAAVARRVAQHYNDGWARGYHLGIRYWEIWNEPDLIPFWTGTPAQFYALYAATSRALARLHPWMQVGGPALTTNNDLTGYRESLLEFIHDNRLPLDFWSFHHYADFSNDPLNFTRISRGYRKLLDEHGFRHARILLTEWNYALTEPTTQVNRAAFAASSLALMQDAPIARAVYHRADREGGPDWQLINDDGSLSKTGHAFEAVGALQRTPLRLAARGGDDQGFSVLAGRGLGGKVRVLMTNYEIPPEDQGPLPFPDNLFPFPGIGTFQLLDRRTVTYTDNAGYDLTVKGLHGRSVVSRYRVDAGHDLTLIDRSVQHGGKVHLSAALPAPAVELVEIARA